MNTGAGSMAQPIPIQVELCCAKERTAAIYASGQPTGWSTPNHADVASDAAVRLQPCRARAPHPFAYCMDRRGAGGSPPTWRHRMPPG